MKNIIAFENFEYDLNEGLFSKGPDFATKFKTVLTYYYKKNNQKNIKYWLVNLAKYDENKIINPLNKQYDKMKPSFGATPGGAVSSSEGNFDLIKKMKDDSHYFDKTILNSIEKYVPNSKDDLIKKLDLKIENKPAQNSAQKNTQVQNKPVQEHVKRFSELF